MVNVVMLVHNRLDLTKQAIWSLLETTQPGQISLTIVDDGSDDATARYLAVLDSFGPCEQFQLVRNETPKGVGGARNQGAEASRKRFGQGEYLYFSDNDVVFTPGWLEAIRHAYYLAQDDGFRVIGGYAHPYNQTIKAFSYKDSCLETIHVHEKHAVDGLSWLLTWDTWNRFGTFCDNVTDRRSSEDHEYCQRIRNAGYRVGVVDPPVIINCGRTDSWGNEIPGATEAMATQTLEGLVVG